MTAPNQLTPLDRRVRSFFLKYARQVHLDEEELGASFELGKDGRIWMHELNQGGPVNTTITFNPDRVMAMAHLHPTDFTSNDGNYERALSFSGLDINCVNELFLQNKATLDVVHYVSVDWGRLILKYDPVAYTITYIPGVWNMNPDPNAGFLP